MMTLTQEEKKEYFTLDEAAAELGMKRSTIYPYLKRLGIKWEKFDFDRRHYVSRQDVERIQALKAQPWKYRKGKDQ